jgi:hypothetical protein
MSHLGTSIRDLLHKYYHHLLTSVQSCSVELSPAQIKLGCALPLLRVMSRWLMGIVEVIDVAGGGVVGEASRVAQ